MKYLATKKDLKKLEDRLFKPYKKGSTLFFPFFGGDYIEPSLEDKIDEVNKRIDGLCTFLGIDLWHESSNKYVAKKTKKNGQS